MSLTAYIRYDNKGRIVPGGPIVTSVKPKVGDWVAISDVLVTTTPPNYKLRAFVRYINRIGGQKNDNKYVAGSLILQQDAPKDGNWKEVYFIKPCESCNPSTTTTTSTSTSTSTTTSTTSTTSTSTSTTTTTTTATPTTTTTTTTDSFQPITLYSNGVLCGVGTDWSQKTPAEVKCDWIEVFAGGSPSYGGSQFLYYASAGFNVGTQLYSETPGNPPITFSGTYIYDLGGPYLNAKVFTVTTGIISAIYELGDLPACSPYICPTTTTTTTAAVGPYTIGQAAQGGIIAYILQPGDPGYDAGVQHGLVVSANDISTGTEWGCIGIDIPGAQSSFAIGTGNQNTIDIMAGCPTAGIAARLCGDLVQGGYSDWYLPSRDELVQVWNNRGVIGIVTPAFAYWTSSQTDPNSAYFVRWTDGVPFFFSSKSDTQPYVRAVRSF